MIAFLARQVEFERGYAIEGGKEAPAALSRFATRALRKLTTARGGGGGGGGGGGLRGARVRLAVAADGRELVASVESEEEAEEDGARGRGRSVVAR